MTSKISASRKTSRRPRGYINVYRPQAKTRVLLEQVQMVLEEYRSHWPLTVRQVFYRLVGAHGFPKDEAAYERLGNHLSNARRARVIPFESIRDDGVTTLTLNHFNDEEHFLRHIRELGQTYKRNKLAAQPVHIEVWCEAAGMIYQLADVAHDYSIKVYSSGGFDSTTARKDIADRICSIGKRAVILHLGDYDPSGVAAFNAFAEDIASFVEADKPWNTVSVEFRRVALTAEQVSKYDLPTAPPKASDSRTKTWQGGTCQLEALAPDAIADILLDAILDCLDFDQLEADRNHEQIDKVKIAGALPAPGRHV